MLEGSYGPISILHCGIGGSACPTTTLLQLSISGSCVLPDLIADLSPGPTPSKLSVRLETVVPVDSNHSPIQDSSIQGLYGEGGLMPRCILHETKSARLHLNTIQAHYKIYDLAARGEKLEELTFEREEGQIADVKSCRRL